MISFLYLLKIRNARRRTNGPRSREIVVEGSGALLIPSFNFKTPNDGTEACNGYLPDEMDWIFERDWYTEENCYDKMDWSDENEMDWMPTPSLYDMDIDDD